MTSATQAPCALQTSGAQHWELSAQGTHVWLTLLHAWPLQSLQVEQLVGVAHAGVDDGVRIASSKWIVRSDPEDTVDAKMEPKSVVGALPPSVMVAAGA
jgi:hypothetical protein